MDKMYQIIKERHGCYAVCFDIKELSKINKVSTKLGDEAIRTAMMLMEDVADEDDICIRIGGDEFAIITNSKKKDYANGIANAIKPFKVVANKKNAIIELRTSIKKINTKELSLGKLLTELGSI